MEISNGTPPAGLASFIRSNIEFILDEWVKFAKTIPGAEHLNLSALLDHAKEMLLVIAGDLDQSQTSFEQSQKSKGLAPSAGKATNADKHGAARMLEGFNVDEMASEFRALRASVTGLWLASDPSIRQLASEELIRFNEAIDQALTESLRKFSSDKDRAEAERTRVLSQYKVVVNSISDGVVVLDGQGNKLSINPMVMKILGYEREEDAPSSVMHFKEEFDLYSMQGQELPSEKWPGLGAFTEETLPQQEYYLFKKGTRETKVVELRATSVKNAADEIILRVVTMRDVTERKRAEEELKIAAAVFEDSSEAMMVADQNSQILSVNRAFTEMTGYEPHEVIGKNPRFLKSGHHDRLFYKDMWEQIESTGRFKGELWNKKKNGDFFAAQLTINTINNVDGVAQRYVGLLSDITERKKTDEVIWTQANFDTLTGLPNRRLFKDHLQQHVRRARRDRTPVALMFLDLDGFKHVNDTLGHDMGDMLLKEAAGRLQHCVRDSDLIARLGGDEFTVILTELHDLSNVDRVARHILRTLADPFQINGEVAHVSASIGITFYPQDATEIDELLKNADQAMYAAKVSGKNQYHYFTPSMQEAAVARMHLVNDLRSALDANQFEIVYQPIVDLSTGTISKAEALIRWQHPTRGLINPLEFISAAEDTGMITSFGNWVFHEAARQAAIWREKHNPAFQISVNISPVQFKKEGVDPSAWLDHLRSLGVPGQGIVVEITEGLLLDASSKVTDQLLMLRDAGIEVALDDFGTGYSSLAYLKKFDIDYLKIDQAFMRNLENSSDDLALCEAIIVMAHKLSMKVIAEGVETYKQHELLANCDCDFAQGYLFSKPVSADELEQLLKAEPFSFQKMLDI